MRLVLAGIVFAVAIFLALIAQEFIPPVQSLYDARVLLVPMLFCYGALILPSGGMLLLAVFTGLLTDLMYLHIVAGQVEIALGWSIVYFVCFGTLSHGLQPGFLRGHWWIHPLMSAAGTSLFLALQYAMICLRRQEFTLNDVVLWRVMGPGLMAAVAAVILHLVSIFVGYFVPMEIHRQKFGLR